ncbi:MAG TPA: hypothetical protein DCX01_01480 [Bacteroidetes bacterium]|jgi:hypothetical protein|nr:hypothetical protein [Bacteroidota bacterium]|tara:strand:+ start:180 stop:503 length:324 start_codon:yes stop_codon:yes gene_type:complete
MENKREKPTPEAKALSLYLMAHKSSDNAIKDKSRKMNKRWDMVVAGELEKTAYQEEVQAALTFYGGYKEVIEKTVKFYIDKFGEWKSQGDDQYGVDAQQIADKLLAE